MAGCVGLHRRQDRGRVGLWVPLGHKNMLCQGALNSRCVRVSAISPSRGVAYLSSLLPNPQSSFC
jgi:hypothetical protein